MAFRIIHIGRVALRSEVRACSHCISHIHSHVITSACNVDLAHVTGGGLALLAMIVSGFGSMTETHISLTSPASRLTAKKLPHLPAAPCLRKIATGDQRRGECATPSGTIAKGAVTFPPPQSR